MVHTKSDASVSRHRFLLSLLQVGIESSGLVRGAVLGSLTASMVQADCVAALDILRTVGLLIPFWAFVIAL